MNNNLRSVELVQAFSWTCDDCGRENFARAVTVAPESIDLDDLPEHVDADADAIKDWLAAGGEGHWLRAPETVTCSHCGATFAAEPA